MAAVVARYETGWILHDLQTTRISLNQEYVSESAILIDGGELVIGKNTLKVSISGGNQNVAESPRNAPCQVTLTAADGVAQSSEISRSTLVGTAMVCDIPFGDNSALRSRHCLLTIVNNRWHVIDLTGSGGTRNGISWHGIVRIFNEDKIVMGHLTLDFALHPSSCEEWQPSVPTPSPGAAATAQDNILNPPLTAQPLSEVDIVDEDVQMVAQDLFNAVRECRLTEGREEPDIGLINKFKMISKVASIEQQFMDGRKLEALGGLRKLLIQHPWDRNLMMTFARMCDVAGLSFLCLNALWLLHRQNRNDVPVMRSIARTCHKLAKQEPQYYDLSIKYWKRVKKVVPEEDRAITQVIHDLTAEQTTQRREFEQIR